MKKTKWLTVFFLVIVLILSHLMCVHVAYAYCDMLWGIKYAGYSAPASIAFLLSIPYLIGIAAAGVLSLVFRKKSKVKTDNQQL